MKRLIKWVFVVGAALVVLLLVVLLVLPRFVDIQQYKPKIEERVSLATGRPFAVGSDLSLSLFPWAGVSFSDLHLGNPQGFQEKDFVSIKSFEVRVKLLPLLFRDIRIKRFAVDGARIVLEKGKDGRTSWGGIGKPSAEPGEREKESREKRMEGFPIKDLTLGELAITNGSVLWIDHGTDARKEISDVTVLLQDVSLNNPIKFLVSSLLDGKPVSLEGSVGPLGKEPGTGPVPLTLSAKAFNELVMVINGTIDKMTSQPRFDLALQVSPFSPRKLMAAMDLPVPVTKDPQALNRVSLKAMIKGNQSMVALSDGVFDLDDSKLAFFARVKEFSKPDVKFDLLLDKIDADRYLPPPAKKKSEGKTKTATPPPAKKKTDYTPLRKLVVNGKLTIGELTIKNARMQDLNLKVSGKDGLFILKPAHLTLYKGTVTAEGSLNVAQGVPKTMVKVQSQGIQVNPLLNDVLKKDILEGTVLSQLDFTAQGDDPDRIKRTLNGTGQLVFTDGAIKGFDLAAMVRNVKDAFIGTKTAEKPRTDFSEFRVPFTATNGVVNTKDTSLKSPFIRVVAMGNTNLVDESLDFRIVPKVVGTLKGQGDVTERSGIMVPIKVTGTFSAPRFAPDLESLVKQKLEGGIPTSSELKETLKKGIDLKKGDSQSLEKGMKGLMKDVLERK